MMFTKYHADRNFMNFDGRRNYVRDGYIKDKAIIALTGFLQTYAANLLPGKEKGLYSRIDSLMNTLTDMYPVVEQGTPEYRFAEQMVIKYAELANMDGKGKDVVTLINSISLLLDEQRKISVFEHPEDERFRKRMLEKINTFLSELFEFYSRKKGRVKPGNIWGAELMSSRYLETVNAAPAV